MGSGKIAAASYGLAAIAGLVAGEAGGGPIVAFLIFWIGGAATYFGSLVYVYAGERRA